MIFQLGDIRCHVVELTGEEVPDPRSRSLLNVGSAKSSWSAPRSAQKRSGCGVLDLRVPGTRCVQPVKDGLVRHHHVNFTSRDQYSNQLDQVVKEIESA